MRATTTIAWKDFRILVFSPMFYLIAGFCCILWSYSYMRNIIQFAAQSMMGGGMMGGGGNMNIQYTVFMAHISQINLISIFAIPALTMRLLAEEKKLRTYDLLLTAPITATDIAVGKFIAAFGAAFVLTFISFLYPLGTGLFATFAWGPLLTAYLGLLLVLALYSAVGLFASSLTESVVLSVVLGVILNLVLWFLSQGADLSDMPWLTSVMEHLSIGQQFMTFIKGSIKISAVTFLVSFIVMFVFLTQRVVESARWR